MACLEPHLPTAPKTTRRPRLHDLREILDAVFYIVRGGCAWRLLPHEFPPWKAVYHYFFRLWRLEGTWERANTALRERLRVRLGRDPPEPRYVWAPKGEEPDWDDLLRARGLLPEPDFKVLPRRWVVERSFAWTGHNRRMSKDYERLPETGERSSTWQ